MSTKPDFWEGYVPEPVKPAQQEPVAWMSPHGGFLSANYINNFASGLDKEIHNIPLYTPPPTQQEYASFAEWAHDYVQDNLHKLKPAQQEPEFITHIVEQSYDWSEWVCPDPKGYLMKCCDCGLVHEAEFGVVRYKSETEREDCDMVEDPNLQAVFRMRRSEQWSPEDTANRAGGLPMEQPAQQEPVAWTSWRELAGARHYRTPGWEMYADKRNPDDVALYTSPPAQPVQDNPLDCGVYLGSGKRHEIKHHVSYGPEPIDTLIAAWQALEETSGHVLDEGDVEGRMHMSVIRSAWEQMDSLVRDLWDERGRK